jgi:hypothetical protein
MDITLDFQPARKEILVVVHITQKCHSQFFLHFFQCNWYVVCTHTICLIIDECGCEQGLSCYRIYAGVLLQYDVDIHFLVQYGQMNNCLPVDDRSSSGKVKKQRSYRNNLFSGYHCRSSNCNYRSQGHVHDIITDYGLSIDISMNSSHLNFNDFNSSKS